MDALVTMLNSEPSMLATLARVTPLDLDTMPHHTPTRTLSMAAVGQLEAIGEVPCLRLRDSYQGPFRDSAVSISMTGLRISIRTTHHDSPFFSSPTVVDGAMRFPPHYACGIRDDPLATASLPSIDNMPWWSHHVTEDTETLDATG